MALPEMRPPFHSIERRVRNRLSQASEALVGPTKAVVAEALRWIRQAEMDGVGRRRVIVRDPISGQAFQLTDVNAKAPVDDVRSNKMGLFVTPVTINEEGKIIREEIGILAPRHPDAVTVSNIYLLRGIFPKAMRRVERQLKRAERVA